MDEEISFVVFFFEVKVEFFDNFENNFDSEVSFLGSLIDENLFLCFGEIFEEDI